MAKPRRYKQIYTDTKDLGDDGGQILLGSFAPISNANQIKKSYFHNVIMTYILQADGPVGSDQGGVVFYLSSSNVWSDNDVVTARASAFGGGSVNLSFKGMVSGETFDDMPGGKCYLWAECTDTSAVLNTSIRYTAEVWGSQLLQYYTA